MPCIHRFSPSDHECYVRCDECGSYRSTVTVPPEQIYTADYWNGVDRSTLADQVYNVDGHLEGGQTKADFVMERIQFSEWALEIGCAPGVMLKRLKQAGFRHVFGMETNESWESDIREVSGPDVNIVFGFFPPYISGVSGQWFDLILALDILEHVADPEAFIAECARLLKPGGQLFIMTPMPSHVVELPERMWNSVEHVWLHSHRHIMTLLRDSGFTDFTFDRWVAGHETASARKL